MYHVFEHHKIQRMQLQQSEWRESISMALSRWTFLSWFSAIKTVKFSWWGILNKASRSDWRLLRRHTITGCKERVRMREGESMESNEPPRWSHHSNCLKLDLLPRLHTFPRRPKPVRAIANWLARPYLNRFTLGITYFICRMDLVYSILLTYLSSSDVFFHVRYFVLRFLFCIRSSKRSGRVT